MMDTDVCRWNRNSMRYDTLDLDNENEWCGRVPMEIISTQKLTSRRVSRGSIALTSYS